MALQAKEMLHKAGFELDKWNSNSPEILFKLSDKLVTESQKAIPGSKDQKVLGVQLTLKMTNLKFTSTFLKYLSKKGGMLSVMHSIYDFLGFAAPVTIKPQFCHREVKELDWDERLPPEESKKW